MSQFGIQYNCIVDQLRDEYHFQEEDWMVIIFKFGTKGVIFEPENKGAAIEKPMFVDQGCLEMRI